AHRRLGAAPVRGRHAEGAGGATRGRGALHPPVVCTSSSEPGPALHTPRLRLLPQAAIPSPVELEKTMWGFVIGAACLYGLVRMMRGGRWAYAHGGGPWGRQRWGGWRHE